MISSVVDYIRKRDAERDKKGTVIEFDGRKITREEYWNLVEHYKNYFLSQGFFYGCGKPVTICNRNVPEYEFMYMALLELGAVVSTVSLSFFMSDIKRHTVDKGADTIVLSAEYITPELKKVLQDVNSGKNKIKRIIFTSAGDFRSEENEQKYNNQYNFRNLIDSLDLPTDIEIVYPSEIKNKYNKNFNVVRSDNPINLLDYNATYSNTGGTTTGIPKCAVHTHKGIIELLKAHENDIFPEFPVKEGDKSLLLIPISHITSQFYALLLRRASGADIIYNPGAFEPDKITKALVEDEISDVIAPFGLYVAVAHSPLKEGDLRYLKPSCGGEPTPLGPTKVVNDLLMKAGSEPIVIGGGSTEFGSAIMTTYGIAGRENETGVLIPNAEAKIINPSTGKEVTSGERGILYAKCPWQMKEYLHDQKATQSFYNYTDDEGNIWGTNNDIAAVTGEYKDKPIYSICGRVNDFVLPVNGTKRYTPGITFSDDKIDPVDLSKGEFLFDMRDKLLNVPGVIEAEALLIPNSKEDKSGIPVVNLVIAKNLNPVDIIKEVYSSYSENDEFVPAGLIFRTNFARSLATDKREIVSLHDERTNYFCLGDEGEILKVTIPEDGNIIYEPVADIQEIKPLNPPAPRKILVK